MFPRMPPPTERQSIEVRAERTVLAAVRLPESTYDPRDPFGELRELAKQAGAVVVGELEQRRERPEAGTYIGQGKLQELKMLCETLEAGCIIFDHELSPKQIAAIENVTERKVLDRSELILDIFASRATTHEAKLQVEIAQLEYTFPRLRAMWDHLERIVGAGGIGIELKVGFDLFDYPTAMTVILMIAVVVIVIEQLSGWARTKIIGEQR